MSLSLNSALSTLWLSSKHCQPDRKPLQTKKEQAMLEEVLLNRARGCCFHLGCLYAMGDLKRSDPILQC